MLNLDPTPTVFSGIQLHTDSAKTTTLPGNPRAANWRSKEMEGLRIGKQCFSTLYLLCLRQAKVLFLFCLNLWAKSEGVLQDKDDLLAMT